MKAISRLIVLLFIATVLAGCAAHMRDAIAKSMATGKTYSELAADPVTIEEGNGRVFVYRIDASTKHHFVYGVGFEKRPTFCTVDNAAFELIWEAFKYVDLPEGEHEITCGNDVLKKVEFWSSKPHYGVGKNKVEVTIQKGVETFVRIDAVDEEPFFQPVIVDEVKGREEISGLPHQVKIYLYADGQVTD